MNSILNQLRRRNFLVEVSHVEAADWLKHPGAVGAVEFIANTAGHEVNSISVGMHNERQTLVIVVFLSETCGEADFQYLRHSVREVQKAFEADVEECVIEDDLTAVAKITLEWEV